MKTIGIDLGGSHAMAALVDDSGTITHRSGRDIEDHAVDAVIKTILTAVQGVLDEAGEKTAPDVGIGSPGNVDMTTGVVRYSPNFGWHDAPLGQRLSEALGVQVHVANDARCATLGEYTFGSGRGTKNFVMLTLGT